MSRRVHSAGPLAAACLVGLLAFGPGCARPAAEGSGDAATAATAATGEDSLRPRITAEHPVTSEAALAAGLWDGGSGGESPAGSAGPVPGAAGPAALTPMLPATDVAAVLAFYTDLLGFDLVASEPSTPPFRSAELARGSARLVLVEPARLARETPRLRVVGQRLEDGAAGAGDEAGAEGAADGADPGGEVADADDADGEAGAASSGGTSAGVPAVLRLALADLDQVAERLTAAGVAAVERTDPTWGREIALADPAGNRLLIVSADSP